MRYLTSSQAARLLGVTKQTLKRWESEGRVTSVREPSNNYRYFDYDAIEEAAYWLRLRRAEKAHIRKLVEIHQRLEKQRNRLPLTGQAIPLDEETVQIYRDHEAWDKEYQRLRGCYKLLTPRFRPLGNPSAT